MKTVIIIPARYQSTRFPGKPLAQILGKPLILWVVEVCVKALPVENVYVATEDLRIKQVVEDAGFNVIMTSDKPLTGTDRVAEAIQKIEADLYVNVQGYEPMLNPDDILKIIEEKKKFPECVVKGYCEISSNEDPSSLNIPKVIFTENHKMVYMSRQMIPGYKSEKKIPDRYFKAVCIYGFNGKNLDDFGRKSMLEAYEDIEVLRFLDVGTEVRMVEVEGGSLAVDEPGDIERVEVELKKRILSE